MAEVEVLFVSRSVPSRGRAPVMDQEAAQALITLIDSEAQSPVARSVPSVRVR